MSGRWSPEAYDAGRPGYAPELVDTVLDHAGGIRTAAESHAGEVRTAVEVGAGTGKATVRFTERGLRPLCLEPDAGMVEVLRRNVPPDCPIEVTGFEGWQRAGRRFDLLYAATSWHWIDPGRRWTLAHEAVTPGGTVALFWNPQYVLDRDLHARLAEVDHRHGVVDSPHAAVADGPGAPGDWDPAEWPAAECRAHGGFTDLREVRLSQETFFPTDRYLAFCDSVSCYRLLPPEVRASALAEVARVLDAHGGGITTRHVTDVFLARSTA